MNRFCKYALVLLVLVVFAGCEETPPATPNAPVYAFEQSGKHVVAFSMQGCPQCEADKPELRQLEAQGVDVVHVTRERNPDLVAQYHVTEYPTYLAMDDGEVKSRSISLAVIIAFLKVAAWIITTFL